MQPCPFCQDEIETICEESGAFARFDRFPVTKLHALVIPRRHVGSFFDLRGSEYGDCLSLLHRTRKILAGLDGSITSYNLGINDGADAGQSIPHCHIHLIPRRKNDVDDPLGGVRHVIPGNGYYDTGSSGSADQVA